MAVPEARYRLTRSRADHLTDASLVAASLRGEAAAFEAIMRRNNQLLFRVARGIVKDDGMAQDVLQEAWLKAWRALSGFKRDARLSTWLTRIVINAAISRTRKGRSAQIIPLESAMQNPQTLGQSALHDHADERPEKMAMRAELRAQLEHRIDQLPDDYRSVFILRGVQELSTTDVAELLHMPEATVRTRYFRARAMLREKLARDIDTSMGDAFSFDGARCDAIVRHVLMASGLAEDAG